MLLFKTYLFITPGKRYEYNKLKIKAPTQNYEFELPGSLYSLSDIQGYIGYIIKNMKHYPLILLSIFTTTELITD